MKQFLKDAASLNSLANSSGDFGHLIKLNGLEVGLQSGQRVSNDVEEPNPRPILTKKSSSSFFDFFFLVPLKPSASTSSVIPRAVRREGQEEGKRAMRWRKQS